MPGSCPDSPFSIETRCTTTTIDPQRFPGMDRCFRRVGQAGRQKEEVRYEDGRRKATVRPRKLSGQAVAHPDEPWNGKMYGNPIGSRPPVTKYVPINALDVMARQIARCKVVYSTTVRCQCASWSVNRVSTTIDMVLLNSWTLIQQRSTDQARLALSTQRSHVYTKPRHP